MGQVVEQIMIYDHYQDAEPIAKPAVAHLAKTKFKKAGRQRNPNVTCRRCGFKGHFAANCMTDVTRTRRVVPQDARNIQDLDDTNKYPVGKGYRISGWTDGYKKQKIQGWNAREETRKHNRAIKSTVFCSEIEGS